MADKDRYDVTNLVEAQYEPGSRGRVLRNLLVIKSKREMDLAEARALKQATDKLVRSSEMGHRFTADDISNFHKLWLGEIYEWAGNYRRVNLSKKNITFAVAAHIPTLMKSFEKDFLAAHTPCNFPEKSKIYTALAEVHTELVLIHPFREGNGRVARILSTLMALQAGLPFLDFGVLRGGLRKKYFEAVRSGLIRDYSPMEEIFSRLIERKTGGL